MVSQANDTKCDQHSLIEPHHPERNNNSPISRLLPELLEPIVVLATSLNMVREPIRVVPYSHVCRSWRYTLISAPLLWRYINADLPRFSEECLLRSKNVSIGVFKITYSLTMPTAPFGWVDLWSLHSHRITEIDMAVTTAIELPLFHSIPSTLPTLTRLRLDNNAYIGDADIVVPFHSLPALRILYLNGINLQDDMWGLVSGLTHLSYLNDNLSGPSLLQIFGIITRSPMLCSIFLAGGSHLPGNLDSMPVLYSPHLRGVHFAQGKTISAFRLLSKLQLPPSCQLTFRAAPSLTSVLPLTANLKRNFQIIDRSCVELSRYEFRLYERTDSNEEHTIFSFGTDLTSLFLSHVVQFFEISKLTFLRIRLGFILISEEDWLVQFTQLSSLTSLELTSVCTYFSDGIPILNALANMSATGTSAKACPQLHWLSLRIESLWGDDVTLCQWKDWRRIREAIVPWLYQRAGLDAAIREFHLKNFEIRPELLELLRGLVEVLNANDVVETLERGANNEDIDGEH